MCQYTFIITHCSPNKSGGGDLGIHLCLCDVEDESLQFEEDRSEPGGGHETCLNCTQKAMSRRRENEGGMWGEATRSKGTKRERMECVR